MTATIEQLIQQLASPDPGVYGRALEALVRRGPEAVPALLRALQNGDAPQVRALAAEGLGLIGDHTAVEPLWAALDDDDEEVRSQAATALAYLDDPRALDALVRTLNDSLDLLHINLSRSAYTLIGLGPAALPAVLPLLNDADREKREKAGWIARKIVSDRLEAGDSEGGPDWSALEALLAGYKTDNAPEARARLVDRALAWVRANLPTGGRHA